MVFARLRRQRLKERVIPSQFEAHRCRTSFMSIVQTKNVNKVEHPDTKDGRKYGYVAQN